MEQKLLSSNMDYLMKLLFKVNEAGKMLFHFQLLSISFTKYTNQSCLLLDSPLTVIHRVRINLILQKSERKKKIDR